MPIDGFPDPKLHKFCCRCAKWHEPDEGTHVPDGRWRPFDWMRAEIGVETLKKDIFVCNACHKRRKRLMGAVVVIFALAVIGIGAYLFNDLLSQMDPSSR